MGLAPSLQSCGEIGVNRTVIGELAIKRSVRRTAIALFGNREADDVRIGRRYGGCHRVLIGRRRNHVLDGTDKAQFIASSRAFSDGVEAVLRIHLFSHVAGAQRNAGDAPVSVARVHGIVGVNCLMRAVECTDAEMDDASPLRAPVVSGLSDILRKGAVWSEPQSRYAAFARP